MSIFNSKYLIHIGLPGWVSRMKTIEMCFRYVAVCTTQYTHQVSIKISKNMLQMLNTI